MAQLWDDAQLITGAQSNDDNFETRPMLRFSRATPDFLEVSCGPPGLAEDPLLPRILQNRNCPLVTPVLVMIIREGLIPKVVMELKGITVGGGYSGMSGESSMHKYGLFQNTIACIEIVLGDGSCITASRHHNRDLLQEAGGSLGTFGVVTLLTVELIPAKSHVEIYVRHMPCGMDVVNAMLTAAKQSTVDFIEGLHLPDGSGIIMLSQMVHRADHHSSATLLKHTDLCWFAEYVEKHGRKYSKQAVTSPLLLELDEYLFRYDQGAFWGGKLAFQHLHIPRNRVTEKLARPFLDSRTCFQALHRTNLANEYVVQDFGLPESTATSFITYVRDTLPDCQLFLSVMKPPKDVGLDGRFTARLQQYTDQWVIGVGIYGRGPHCSDHFERLNRDLEHFADLTHGIKLLYARVWYTPEEFWKIYDRESYDVKRRAYRATALLDMFDKLTQDMSHPHDTHTLTGTLKTVCARIAGRKKYLL